MGEKRKTLDNIKDWKKQTKEDGKNADDQDLEAILNKQQAEKRPPGTDRRKPVTKSKKAAAKDAKFGFGGKKRAKKRNDAASSRDMSSLLRKKVKGKGKGKSGGGKGKGKGEAKRGEMFAFCRSCEVVLCCLRPERSSDFRSCLPVLLDQIFLRVLTHHGS